VEKPPSIYATFNPAEVKKSPLPPGGNNGLRYVVTSLRRYVVTSFITQLDLVDLGNVYLDFEFTMASATLFGVSA
jgi:hypothetical protein